MKHLFNRPLTVGTYKTSKAFAAAPVHIAVMFDDDHTLVACTGYADDPVNVQESFAYAHLFANAPALLEALDRAADAITNEDLSQSERAYEARLAREAIEKATQPQLA